MSHTQSRTEMRQLSALFCTALAAVLRNQNPTLFSALRYPFIVPNAFPLEFKHMPDLRMIFVFVVILGKLLDVIRGVPTDAFVKQQLRLLQRLGC